ncbi:MAG: glycosyltransferase [Sphingomicrobium sp.]
MSSADAGRGARIALLLPSLKFGGGERVALNLAHALKALGCQVTILLMSHEGEYLEAARGSFEVVDLRCNRTYKLPQRLISYLFAQPTDLLISSYWKLNLCAAFARLFAPKLRLLVWEHSPPTLSRNSPTWLYAPSASLAYRLADKVICVSQGVSADVAGCTIGLGTRLTVIHNPIPGPSLSIARELGGRPTIAWVGRLDDPKNPGLMLDGFALLAPVADADLVFIGDGRQRAGLEERSTRSGLAGRVRFAGYQAEPYAMLAKCDLLALTSDREGLPTVIVEALHVGLGVVSTDCGLGVHEILGEGTYGTIVPLGDPAALARGIAAELEHRRDPAVQRLGAARFEPATIARQFLAAAGLGKRVRRSA